MTDHTAPDVEYIFYKYALTLIAVVDIVATKLLQLPFEPINVLLKRLITPQCHYSAVSHSRILVSTLCANVPH